VLACDAQKQGLTIPDSTADALCYFPREVDHELLELDEDVYVPRRLEQLRAIRPDRRRQRIPGRRVGSSRAGTQALVNGMERGSR
jgi:hypothetical protein